VGVGVLGLVGAAGSESGSDEFEQADIASTSANKT
jgi:hypothetical protein